MASAGCFCPIWGFFCAGLLAVWLIRKARPFLPEWRFKDFIAFGLAGAVLTQVISMSGLRWYSMAYITGAVLAVPAGFYLIKKGRLFFAREKVWDIVIWGALGAALGGRFGFCLFYRPDLFVSFDQSFPFWGLLKANEGGMSSHGGIAGVFLALWIFSLKASKPEEAFAAAEASSAREAKTVSEGQEGKIPFFSLMDLAAVGGAAGIFLGRIANFINGELVGREIKGQALLGVKFPSELYLWGEKASEYQERLLSLKPLLPVLKRLPNPPEGLPGGYVWEDWILRGGEGALYQVSRVCGLIAARAGEAPVRELLEPLLSLRHPSQLYQSFFGGVLPFLAVCLVWQKPRAAGLAALVWLASYSGFRVTSEFFRMPDASVGYQLFQLTRGQWLSLLSFFWPAPPAAI